MKQISLTFILSLIGVLSSMAGKWELGYLNDEFGDSDYSKPGYKIVCVNPQDERCYITIAYINGIFALEPVYNRLNVEDASIMIKIKGADGKIHQFTTDKPHRKSGVYLIGDEYDVEELIDLLEQGNFTISFVRPADYYEEAFNYNFKIGKQGQGIRTLTPPSTYRGKIGKSLIILNLNISTASNSGVSILYGECYKSVSGKDEKFTLKGKISYDSETNRIYTFDEYDNQGRKCGSYNLKDGYDYEKYEPVLNGSFKNSSGTSFPVSLQLVFN